MNYSFCSDGTRISEAGIKAKYSEALKKKHAGNPRPMCEAYPNIPADHNDHTIAKARCKVLHKTELIWNPDNFVSSSAKAHNEWESFKSGEWIKHANMEKRLAFLKEHDPEGFAVRVNLTQLALSENN